MVFGPPDILNHNAAADAAEDADPRIATGAEGSWVVLWSSKVGYRGQLRRDEDILFARSVDGGRSWTEPRPLHDNASDDRGADLTPTVAAGPGGLYLAAWSSAEDLGGQLGSDIDLLTARSTDAGQSWTSPVALNTNAGHDYGDDEKPTLTGNGRDLWLAVWQSADSLLSTVGGDRDILFARSTDGGAQWNAPQALNTNARSDTGFDISPRSATDGNGAWVVVWSSDDPLDGSLGRDRDILFARSTDDGLSWSAPAMLATSAATDQRSDWEPSVAVDSDGNWVVAWSSSATLGDTIARDRDILTVRSTDAGATWTQPAPLNTNASVDSSDDSAPELEPTGGGHWLALWQSWDRLGSTIGADADILSASSSDGGASWSPPRPISARAADDVGEDVSPDLATDGKGGWVSVWRSNEPREGQLGADPDIHFAVGRALGARP